MFPLTSCSLRSMSKNTDTIHYRQVLWVLSQKLGQKEPLCMHMRFLVPLLLDNNINNFIGTHTQNYSFKRHHEPRSKTGSDHYPYNIVMCVFTRQPSPKQLSEENGRNFGEKANETINYLSQTIARIAENGLNSQESKNYNFFESFNIFEQFS